MGIPTNPSSVACPEGQITSGRRTHPSSHRQGSVADEQFGRVNRPDWSLVTKSTLGGQAIWQAVTRVKLEQASKVKSWKPTPIERGRQADPSIEWGRPRGQGRSRRCTCRKHRGSEHGMSERRSG